MTREDPERFAMANKNRICSRCVMDGSDPLIEFDEHGKCNHCRRAELLISAISQLERPSLEKWAEGLEGGVGSRSQRSIIGLSGGIDSSYVALLLSRLGIRPLVVHVDAGWNNEVAVTNIRKIVDRFDLDLETVVINWQQMRALQNAFLKSGVRNQDIPQDHAFFASLYSLADRYKIRNVITGANISTESILPSSWGSDAMDGKFLVSVAKSQGLQKLDRFPISRLPSHYLMRMAIGKMVIHKPLDMISYRKDLATRELEAEVGWRDYGGKHRESMFTAWFQHVYLPRRFGIDKRKAHLSSLIVSNQLTRDAALMKLSTPEFTELEEATLTRQVSGKLGLSLDELTRLTYLPEVDESHFSNDQWVYSKSIARIGRRLLSPRNQVLRNIDIKR